MDKSLIATSVTMVAMAVAATSPAVAASKAEAAKVAVQATLDASAAAWNAADLDRFMGCYEKSDEVTYVSGARYVAGYDAIRAMYAERFGGGSKAAMGELKLEILGFRLLDDSHAHVVGRFHLHRDAAAGGDATGLTTLVFAKTLQGWRIVADHS